MIRRPKATDTEEDLLAFQRRFLESNENPSVFLYQGSNDSNGLKVGKKRSQHSGDVPQLQERDVVQLQTEDYSSQEGRKPPLKKSRFKERREKSRMKEAPEDPHEAMERQDQHITKVLADIQEQETLGFSSSTVPTLRTRRGFPSVHALDDDVIPKSSHQTTSDRSTRVAQSKSLFAQQFEKHGLEYFGIETTNVMQPQGAAHLQRDFVEPVNVGGRTMQTSESGKQSTDTSRASPSFDVHVAQPMVGDTFTSQVSDISEVREYDSSAAQTWDRFTKSSLISCERVRTDGVSKETADHELSKIHQENVKLLSSLSDEEILSEKRRIEQRLGPKLVSFLLSKKKKKKIELQDTNDDDGVGLHVRDSDITDVSLKSPPSLNVAPPKGWVHMDIVEKDKMEWMTDVTTHHTTDKSDSDQSKEVRFSLNGLVIPHHVDIPTHLGLHHHGDEPQAAGYTLNELVPFCRSTVLQQRVLGLQTLAKIIQRAKQGEYSSLVEGSVLEKLLNDGVPLLFRLALDESNNSVMFAAINAIHSLLVLPIEEFVLEEYSYCYYGHVLPSLKSHDHPQPSEDETENEKETDAEIFQRDVIEGFLHVKLLHRIRYILEVCCPPAITVNQLLDILISLARHSTAASSQVLNCPRLMSVMFKEFLPLSWREEEEEEGSQRAYGRPQVAAMKLIMTLCSAGRHLTAHLISDFNLMSVISRYTILHPCDLCLPKEKAFKLATISLKTWTIALHYGLGGVAFRDAYSVVLQQLQKFSTLNLLEIDQLETKRIAALFKLVQAALYVSAVTPEQLKTESEKVELKPPALEWSCASGMLSPVTNCLMRWMEQMHSVDKEISVDKLECIAGLIHYVADYYNKLSTQKPEEISVEVLQAVESLASGVVNKLLHSTMLAYAIETLSTTSSFTSDRSAPDLTSSHSSLVIHLTLLPSPKQACYGMQTMQLDDYQKLFHPRLVCFSCSDFVLSFLNLCLALSQLHKGTIEQVTQICANHKFKDYLESVHTSASKCLCCDFEELYLLYSAVKLYNMKFSLPKMKTEKEVQLFHRLSFKLVALFPPGMEHLVYNLFQTIMLNPGLFCPSTSFPVILEKDVENMTLSEPTKSSTLLQQGVHDSIETLLATAVKNLPSISNAYLSALEEAGVLSRKKVDKSKKLFEHHPLKTHNMLLSSYHAPSVPVDWVLFPIIQEYNKSVVSKHVESVEVVHKTSVIVLHTLQLLLLLEYFHPTVLQEVSVTAKLTRLMCVFLIGSDLFLDHAIRSVLLVLLKLYCTEEVQAAVNFDVPVPGLTSFEELYSSLLDQFAAVSYGDHLFACFIMLPLQQRFSVHFRRMVWNDYSSIIRIFSLPLSQVPVDVKHFLYPVETDASLLKMYISALASNTVRHEWSPLFYLVAIHHVHCYVFEWNDNDTLTTQELNPLQKILLQGVLQLKDEELRRHLLFYDRTEECRLKFKSVLNESHRSKLLSLVENNPSNPLIVEYM